MLVGEGVEVDLLERFNLFDDLLELVKVAHRNVNLSKLGHDFLNFLPLTGFLVLSSNHINQVREEGISLSDANHPPEKHKYDENDASSASKLSNDVTESVELILEFLYSEIEMEVCVVLRFIIA